MSYLLLRGILMNILSSCQHLVALPALTSLLSPMAVCVSEFYSSDDSHVVQLCARHVAHLVTTGDLFARIVKQLHSDGGSSFDPPPCHPLDLSEGCQCGKPLTGDVSDSVSATCIQHPTLHPSPRLSRAVAHLSSQNYLPPPHFDWGRRMARVYVHHPLNNSSRVLRYVSHGI